MPLLNPQLTVTAWILVELTVSKRKVSEVERQIHVEGFLRDEADSRPAGKIRAKTCHID